MPVGNPETLLDLIGYIADWLTTSRVLVLCLARPELLDRQPAWAGGQLHVSSIVIRGTAVDDIPWSNMYEFASVVGLIAVCAFLGVLARAPQLRYLGVFVMLPVVPFARVVAPTVPLPRRSS